MLVCDVYIMNSTTRRSILRVVGVTTAASLAGCNSAQEGDGNNANDPSSDQGTDAQSADDDTETFDGTRETLDVSEVDIPIGEDWVHWNLRDALADELLIVARTDEVEVVQYAGETNRGFHNVHGDFTAVDSGVAYKAIDELERDGQVVREWVIMSGGDELYRKDDGERPRTGDIQIYGAMDGEPLWIDRKDAPGTIRKGLETIETSYDEVNSLAFIDGELGYIGHEARDGYTVADAVVIGGEVVADVEGTVYGLTDVNGDPAYVESTTDGDTVVYQGNRFGGEYTTRSRGELGDIFELDDALGFVATVAESKMENPDYEQEQVLWYDGDVIARHHTIDRYGAVNGRIWYSFRDRKEPGNPDSDFTSGIMWDGELLAPDRDPSLVHDINGTPTYSIETDDGNSRKIIYGNQETEDYDRIGTIVEKDGRLYFEAEIDGKQTILKEQ